MKNVALYNLGCKVNSYETDGMRQMLEEKGYRIVPFDRQADIYIVNTCTVTNIADRKSRQILHRAKQLNPDAVVVAVGCYVQTGREAVEKDESIDLAIGNNHKKDIVEILETFLADRQDKTLQGRTVPEIGNIREYEEMQLRRTSEHTRAYIKVQDGCNQFCSYCAIPYARGRVRSRRAEDVLREVRGMTEAGYREVVLTGIHLSSYGIDFEGDAGYNGSSCLLDLTEKLHEIPGVERIRLGSLEPRIITSETAERMAAMPKLCPHFHLSLQSGCDNTLKRMNRHYTAGEYYNSVEILRRYFANPAVTTDVITGFPGETEEEFRQTREFLEKVCFYEIHVFKYSRRAGTAAAIMPNQVPEQVKVSRSKELLELTARQSVQFRSGYIGRDAEVLLEEEREIDGRVYLVGHTKDYVKAAVDITEKTSSALPVLNTVVKIPVKKFLTDEILV
ncbi:tRNA (N(6)-L-threonylcarbamoyladenosine(37)-C(2))-methylthiotransferase MtaB [Acetatifactor muris]|uniref:Threonylcarbamoyladenosine tRNA methylthiotransferase MtaB n=1 Tax=Acetatifactor muris TaxID=879566 RepID=A0A2K4ZBA7_9FIRM|nr:tRNA (N(6)-L-threonylcarbamoyladenosine(37)-C(2))-methylthiotransferase MtaB [Acetatifactor muris]MCI8798726.1 tRNA (N(6)-L-threonylcarbamoyladenosine(37)-C(2))-methylthiotransferase MtaB [Lachnospiraceae bacterium]MCR2046151.1 tRNA (N(6)-L-threonylcarbamoyladenosine(37)-C(2))-methylthiotransferase MtaB [Acetatifactor muris]SOY27742.1 Threonylcarbamoyladenosine tRNA methylthiotransferase MtaB [Acetatifactor muris]